MIQKRAPGMWVYLILCNALIFCVSFCCILKTGLTSIAETAEKQTAQNLRTFAHSLVAIIPDQSDDIDTFLKALALKDPGFRITVIDQEGNVIGDSDALETSRLDNHRYREEVATALAGQEGTAIRTSTVNKKSVMYYAIPFMYKSQQAVLRLSMPLETSVVFSSGIRSDVVIVFVCILVAALCVSLLIASYISRQIHELQRSSTQYSAGNFDYRPDISAPREMSQLADSFSSMAQQIKSDIQDISRRRDAFKAVFNGTTEGLIVFDRTMAVQKWNYTAERFFAITEMDRPGSPLIQIVRNAEIYAFACETAASNAIAKSTDEISVQLRSGDSVSDVLVRCVPIGRDADNDRFLLIINDITKIKRLEQVRKDFVANVSHELKTPVTSIKGFAETLLEEPAVDAETQRHFLSIINSQSGRLINIIEDLLTLSRLDQESKPPEVFPTDITELTRSICSAFQQEALAKNITVSFTATQSPLTVNLDAGLYSHAINNLLENAFKYCPEGSSVTCAIMPQSDNYVTVIVEDNGPGIPDMYKERIFERFFRVDQGRSREHGGTGLGLAITSHIAKIHGGTVTESSRPDGKLGAHFELTLPLVQS